MRWPRWSRAKLGAPMPDRTEDDIERMITALQARNPACFTAWELQFVADVQEANDGGFLSRKQIAKLEELYAR